MKEGERKPIKKDIVVRTIVVVVLLLVAISETSVVVRDFHTNRQAAGIPVAERHFIIEPWMTFNYVNILYNLPIGYLRGALAITDFKYPNIEIRRYAKEQGIDQTILVEQINAAINRYGGM